MTTSFTFSLVHAHPLQYTDDYRSALPYKKRFTRDASAAAAVAPSAGNGPALPASLLGNHRNDPVSDSDDDEPLATKLQSEARASYLRKKQEAPEQPRPKKPKSDEKQPQPKKPKTDKKQSRPKKPKSGKKSGSSNSGQKLCLATQDAIAPFLDKWRHVHQMFTAQQHVVKQRGPLQYTTDKTEVLENDGESSEHVLAIAGGDRALAAEILEVDKDSHTKSNIYKPLGQLFV